MNQEQNNLNPNNFNTQSDNVLPVITLKSNISLESENCTSANPYIVK